MGETHTHKRAMYERGADQRATCGIKAIALPVNATGLFNLLDFPRKHASDHKYCPVGNDPRLTFTHLVYVRRERLRRILVVCGVG